MKVFKANLATKFVVKIAKAGKFTTEASNDVIAHSTTRVVRLAVMIKKDTFI